MDSNGSSNGRRQPAYGARQSLWSFSVSRNRLPQRQLSNSGLSLDRQLENVGTAPICNKGKRLERKTRAWTRLAMASLRSVEKQKSTEQDIETEVSGSDQRQERVHRLLHKSTETAIQRSAAGRTIGDKNGEAGSATGWRSRGDLAAGVRSLAEWPRVQLEYTDLPRWRRLTLNAQNAYAEEPFTLPPPPLGRLAVRVL